MFRNAAEIAPGVWVTTSRRMLTTSTILTDGRSAFLVDPAWDPHELDSLADDLTKAGVEVVGGFATHAHHDHLLWHPGFGEAPRWASARTAELAISERDELVEALGDFPADLSALMGRVRPTTELPTDALPDKFEIELVIHDGHAPGHTALWLPRQRVLLAGDMLSDMELPLPFWPDDVPAYLVGLDRLAEVVDRAQLVVPGHGRVGTDARERLNADRRYLDQVMRTGQSGDPRIRNEGMAEMHRCLQKIARDR